MTKFRKPHMLFVSQEVIDIKIPIEIPELAKNIGDLREYLQVHSLIPGDKFTGNLAPIEIDKQGNLRCELSGGSLDSRTPSLQTVIQHILPLKLNSYDGEWNLQDIFSTIEGISIKHGGKIHNMLLNTLILIEALSLNYPIFNNDNLLITTATSGDPFDKLNPKICSIFRDRVDTHHLSMPDRSAVHLPYEYSDRRGVMAITSEPMQTSEFLHKLIADSERFARTFRSATCFVSSDPFFQMLPSHALAPYAYVINSSPALRALVAVSAYGTNALLPMNQGEAREVCKLMLSRARGTELDQTETPRFPSPLTIKEDAIDPTSLGILDSSIDMFSRYNPFFQRAEGFSFACPISFGPEGGLIIGMNKGPIACFTSTLSKQGEKRLFDEYSFPVSEEIHKTGAGDSVAAVVALFNTVSPEVLIVPYLEGKETHNRDLKHLASTIFVSCLSRILGNLQIRTAKTNLTHLKIESLVSLIEDVAKESVAHARKNLKLLSDSVFGVIEKWDIKVALWILSRL